MYKFKRDSRKVRKLRAIRWRNKLMLLSRSSCSPIPEKRMRREFRAMGKSWAEYCEMMSQEYSDYCHG